MEHSFKFGSSEFRFSFESDRVEEHLSEEMGARMAEMNASIAAMDATMAARTAEMDARMAEFDAEMAEFDTEMAAMDAEFEELEDDRKGAEGHFHDEYFDEQSGEHVSSRAGSYSIGPLHVQYRSKIRRSHG